MIDDTTNTLMPSAATPLNGLAGSIASIRPPYPGHHRDHESHPALATPVRVSAWPGLPPGPCPGGLSRLAGLQLASPESGAARPDPRHCPGESNPDRGTAGADIAPVSS